MASLGQLSAQLKLDGASAMTAGLRGVGNAASGLTGLLSKIQGPLALLGVSFAAFKSAEGISESLKGVFNAGRELQTLSRTTGQSVRDLVVLQKAFGAAGLSAEQVPESLIHMQRALGGINEEGQPTNTTFTRLGLSIQKLKGETAVQQLTDIGAAIRKLPNQTDQAAAAMNIFSRSGAEMLAVFADPTVLDGAAKSAGGAADIFQRSAGVFAAVSNDLRALGGKMRGFFAGVADQIAPVLLPLLDKLKSIDLTGLGEQVGGVVRMIAAALQSANLGAIFSASMEVGIAEAINYLMGALPPIGRALAKLLGEDLDGLLDGLANAMSGVSDLIGAGLLRAFEGPVRYLQAGTEAALQTAQHLADVAAGKREDKEGLGSMSADERGALADKYHQAAMDRANLVRAQAQTAGKSGAEADRAATGDASYKEMQGYAMHLRAFDPSKYQARVESIDEIMARNTRDPVRFGGGAGRTADEMERDGRKTLQAAPAQLSASLGSIGDTLRTFFKDLKPANVVDDAKAKATLASLWGSLSALGGAAGNAPGGTGLAGSGLVLTAPPKMAEGDRLARVGGFVGGGGGPALDYNRRTASATEKTVERLSTLIAKMDTGSGHLNLVWQ